MSNEPRPSDLPAPGWYEDPSDPTRLRWWDGAQWGTQLSTDPPFALAMEAVAHRSPLRPIGEWLGDTFRQSVDRAGHYLPMIVLAILPVSVIGAFVNWNLLQDLVLVYDPEAGSFSSSGVDDPTSLLLSLALAQVVATAIAYWLYGAITDQAQHHRLADPVSWSSSLKTGLARLPRVAPAFVIRLVILVAVVAAAGLVSGLLSAVSAPLGALALTVLVPLVYALVWTRLSLVGTAAAVGPGNPIARSWRLTATWTWALLGRFIVLLVMFFAVWLTTNILSSLFGVSGAGEPSAIALGEPIEFRFVDLLPGNPATYAIGAVFAALGSGVRQVLLAVGSLGLYHDLGGPSSPLGSSSATSPAEPGADTA